MSAAAETIPQSDGAPETPLNIYQRINEVRKKVWYARKDKNTDQGYRAVTHDAVTALVRNHLIEWGVLIVPRLMSSSVSDVGKTQRGATIIRYEASFEIDFVNCDKPDERISLPIEAHANDYGDKAPGKAVSYATKYAILKLFNIETGEDEESRVEPYGGAPKVSEEQVAELEELLTKAEADRAAFLKWLKVDEITAIQAKSFDTCKRMLEAKIEGKSKRTDKTNDG